ncbi:MAG: DUF192 domain-containing protein [Candidatus Woesearchaeota archaeon]|nr:DUF192 domain-containing protein [Candidatus Woesearchaeota archaeon]
MRNKSKETVLHENPRWATSVWQLAKGFMFTAPKNDALIMVFSSPQEVRLHMLFVFAPIDVIALNESGKVIAIKEEFKPWTFWHPGVKASAVLELPAGTIARSRTEVGDTIQLPDTIGK